MLYKTPTAELASQPASSADDPAGYLPDDGLIDAVNVALLLGKPLLLTGDPGTGKTQLAFSLAWQLARQPESLVPTDHVERFETKSTSLATDLFYRFDAVGRFQAAREGSTTGENMNRRFIKFNALGHALLRALPSQNIPAPLQAEGFGGPTQSVVLIDEVDKAPRDFPNDILGEIEGMYLRVPELDNIQIGGPSVLEPKYKPVVVITSNSEKNLPEAFLRRCVYYNIPLPTGARLEAILRSRLAPVALEPGGGGPRTSVAGPLIPDAVTYFDKLTGSVARRQTSPAELIDWLTYMLRRGVQPNQTLRAAKSEAASGISALAKNRDGQKALLEELNAFLA